MNTIDTSQLLQQLRAAAAEAKNSPMPTPAAAPQEANGASFSSLLKQSLDGVNEAQKTSGDLKTRFEMGDPKVSLPEVMIAGGKAQVAFQAMVQVRNKFVQAYQEIMRMQV